MFFWHWLVSKKFRQAAELRRQIRKFLNAQRDILKPDAISALEKAIADLGRTLAAGPDRKTLDEAAKAAEETANRHLKPYPHASLRENIDVVLVAVAVALGIRTFFLQPFKIPTGSMQPTLYGITHPAEDLRNDPSVEFPTGIRRWVDSWFYGISYYHKVAKADGVLEEIEPARTIFPLVKRQRLRVGAEWYPVWFPPDNLETRGHLRIGQRFRAGDDILKTWVKSGDHLFVNRFTYNFRRPRRGEIIVFETKGIDANLASEFNIPRDQFYIKRLVAMSGETVRIGDDQHLVINGVRLDASTPHFENVYSFKPDAAPNEYFGHTHVDRRGILYDSAQSLTVQPNHYLVMGDNTRSSLDSRYFGGFPREYVIGKSCFVYWPISERFGWSHR